MRLIPPTLGSHIRADPVKELAVIIRVVRTDGTEMGFTNFSRNLVVDGVTYRANSGAGASAFRQTEDLGVDNMEFIGLVSSELVTDTDIKAGRYSGALVELWIARYTDSPIVDRVLITRGTIGKIQLYRGQWVAEIRGLMQRLQQTIGELTSPTCRVRVLGDARCKLDLTPLTFVRTVAQIVSPTVLRFDDTHDTDLFSYGTLTFSAGTAGGANERLAMEIKHHAKLTGPPVQAEITLQLPFPFAVTVGDEATLVAGCNRTLDRCFFFENVVNFRGEPYLPGSGEAIKIGRPGA